MQNNAIQFCWVEYNEDKDHAVHCIT
jgi:hypothetical protein